MSVLFQHRHYAWLASWLKQLNMEPAVTLALAKRMANDLERDNPRFDRERFLEAAEGYPVNWRDEDRNNRVPVSGVER